MDHRWEVTLLFPIITNHNQHRIIGHDFIMYGIQAAALQHPFLLKILDFQFHKIMIKSIITIINIFRYYETFCFIFNITKKINRKLNQKYELQTATFY